MSNPNFITDKQGTITLTYDVGHWEYEDGQKTAFDWTLSNGTTSDELFDSVEDAEYDVRSRF